MKIFPISYYSIFLVVLLCINKKKASYFYPFMVTTSVLGIVSVIVGLLYPDWDKKQEEYVKTIPFNFSYHDRVIFNTCIIFIKLLILAYWPVNRSKKAYLISLLWVVGYIIVFLLNNYLNKYSNGEGIRNNIYIQQI